MEQKDELIWKRIQRKDIKAFEAYYKEHYKSFYMMACKFLKDSILAEEVVNDVFMKIWEDGAKINIEISLKSYIYKATINGSINLLQKIRKEEQKHTSLEFLPEKGYELREMEENEFKMKLYAAIDRLPEQCKKVFEMSRFEELKQQEIADKLGISIKTVKNHITHALKELSSSVDHFIILVMIILKIFYF